VLRTNAFGEEFIDLLHGIMKYSPSERLCPMQILQHKFFGELRVESVYQQLRK
jgi:hypothetical protein